MKTKHFFIFLIGFFLNTSLSMAQDANASNNPTTDDRLKSLESVISKMPQFSGLINVRYQYATINQNYYSGKNGFDLRRLYLTGKGNLTKTISYKFQIDFASSPKILDAYAEWKPLKNLGLQLGQFKLPYTLENPYSPSSLELIDNSQVITALISDYNNNGRDIGLSLNGSFLAKDGYNIIDYKLGLLNGNGINKSDNNTTKDFFGTLLINPIKPLTLGASYYQGQYGADSVKYDRNRTSFGARYDDGKLLVRAEYVLGEIGTSPVKIKDASGYYATIGYYVTKKIQPVVKYDFYQSDNDNDDSSVTQYVAGVNYWFYKNSRLQFNYTRKDNKSDAVEDSDYFVTQLLIVF